MPRSRRLSDATLVRRSQQGDRRAFTALLTRYDWRLRGLAHALLLDPAEMDAALGVGYLRAWRDVVRISPSDNVAAWLYRVAYNACIDQLRRADGGTPRSASPSASGGIAAGLATLEAAERVVVVLVDREGFSPSSAARIMGLTPDAVTATLDRARATLAEHVPMSPPGAGVPALAESEPGSAPGPDVEPVARDDAHAAPLAGAAQAAGAPAETRADDPDDGGATATTGDTAEATVAAGTAEAAGAAADAAEAAVAGTTGTDEAGGTAEATGTAVAAGTAEADGAAADAAATEAAETGDAAEAAGADELGETDPDDTDDHGPIDHEAVAAAVVSDASTDGVASLTSPVPGGASEPGGVGREASEPGGASEPDSVGGNGNGNAAKRLNGHTSNSGRGRRARRRAKHAATQRQADGRGPTDDGTG